MEIWSKRIQDMKMAGVIPIPGAYNTGIFTLVAFCILATFITLDLYLCYFITSFPDGSTLPISVNTTQNPCYSSPFCVTNVKSLMMDPPDFYLHTPGSILFVNWLDLVNSFQFITANRISFFHVLVALFGSKLITNDSLCVRRIGVLLFQLRNFLDGVDGVIGKARRKQASTNLWNTVNFTNSEGTDAGYSTTISLQDTHTDLESSAKLGYWIDGICDGLGSSFLFLACYFYLQKHPARNRSSLTYTSLPVVITARNCSSNKDRKSSSNIIISPSHKNWTRQFIRTINRSGFLAILYGFQALLSTITWNRFILHYTQLLEKNVSPTTNQSYGDTRIQANLIRSPAMWMVILAWRYVNPHTWIEILLMAVFFDRIGELVYAFRLRGFLIVLITTLVTFVHLQYIQYIMG